MFSLLHEQEEKADSEGYKGHPANPPYPWIVYTPLVQTAPASRHSYILQADPDRNRKRQDGRWRRECQQSTGLSGGLFLFCFQYPCSTNSNKIKPLSIDSLNMCIYVDLWSSNTNIIKLLLE